MKRSKVWLSAIATLAIAISVSAETVHQSLPGNKIYAGDGGSAVAKGKMEVQKVDGAASGEVARVKGSMEQWGYVTCWFGLPAPAGKSVVRLHVYVDGQKSAKYMLYTISKEGQTGIGTLKIPADAKEKTFVDIDIPVDAKGEWNGLTIKKAEKSDLPSPWIDSVSVVLPD